MGKSLKGISISDYKQSLSELTGNDIFIDKNELKELKDIKKLAEEIHLVYTYYLNDKKRLDKLISKLGEIFLKEQYKR